MPNPHPTNIPTPTKYSSETLVQTRKYLDECELAKTKLPTVGGLALCLHVNEDTIVEWAKKYPEFKELYIELKTKQREMLIQGAVFSDTWKVNPGFAKFLLNVNYGMVEKTHTDITTEGQRLAAPMIILDTKPQ